MKLKYNEYYRIKGYEKKHTKKKLFLRFELFLSDTRFYVNEYMPWPIFILLWIPMVITEFFSCLWEDGLRYFVIPCKHDYDQTTWIYEDRDSYNYCARLWDYRNERKEI